MAQGYRVFCNGALANFGLLPLKRVRMVSTRSRMHEALTILLAEDNADDVFLLEQAFKKAGATSRIVAVSDGAEVLQFLQRGEAQTAAPPDLLLLDLNMPRMNGFEVLKALRSATPPWRDMFVIVFSASGLPRDVTEAYALGANAFVVKPNRIDQLVSFVSVLHQWVRFLALPRGLPAVIDRP